MKADVDGPMKQGTLVYNKVLLGVKRSRRGNMKLRSVPMMKCLEIETIPRHTAN